MRTCSSCGEGHAYQLVARGDLERTFDFTVEWQGIRLLCPKCGALQRTSFASVALTNQPPAWAPEGVQTYAVVREGPQVIPFPRRSAGAPDPER